MDDLSGAPGAYLPLRQVASAALPREVAGLVYLNSSAVRDDRSLLRGSDQVWEDVALHTREQCLVGFVDCIGAEAADKSLQHGLVFRGRPLVDGSGREFWQVGAGNELRIAT